MEVKAALWLEPKPGSPLHEALQQLIQGLAPLFDDAPKFEPHITLTTDIYVKRQSEVDQILDSALAAANAVPELTVTLEGLRFGTNFFRKVMLGVQKSAELFSLAMICRERFVIYPKLRQQSKNFDALPPVEQQDIQGQASQQAYTWAKDEYTPHLSLVYSNVYTLSEAVKQTIEHRLQDVFGPTYASRGIGWTGGRISLVDLSGTPDHWPTLGYRDI